MATIRWELAPTERFTRAFRQLQTTDPRTARRILKALTELRELDDPTDRCKALAGPMVGLWRQRIGDDYRVILDIRRAELTLIALDLGHRSAVYD